MSEDMSNDPPSRIDASSRITESLRRALAGEPVCVGTLNAAKCEAVRSAFERLQTDPSSNVSVLAIEVASGVSEQPLGFDEIAAGARNRARGALESGRGVLGVGIEDGLVPIGRGAGGESIFNFGCAWVTDGEREGSGFSSGFAYPGECLGPATRGQVPIGELFDALWRRRRDPQDYAASGVGEGNIGKLTGGRLPRSDYGSHAVLCALVRFLHRDLYD
jgi:inosine/xanthosine triphosphatase